MRAQWFGRREWLNRAMLAAVMAAVPAGAAAQSVAVLSGRVVHAATQAAVSGAAVVLEEAGRTTLSSADGTFAIENVPVGTYHVLVAANGFVPYRAEIAVTAGGASMRERPKRSAASAALARESGVTACVEPPPPAGMRASGSPGKRSAGRGRPRITWPPPTPPPATRLGRCS